MKKFKKGFTLVELVIVISVIAILSAILIPTFANVINMSKLSSDKQLVRSLSQILIGSSKPSTAKEAITIMCSDNYKETDLILKSDSYIVWNKDTNVLAIIDKKTNNYVYSANENFKDTYSSDTFNKSLWMITDKLPDNPVCNIAVTNGFNQANVTTSVGFDTANNTYIKNINISGANATIVTNDFCQKINITDSTIYHYGKCGQISAENSDVSEYGICAKFVALNGKVNAFNTIYCMVNSGADVNNEQNVYTGYTNNISACTEHNDIAFENSLSGGYIICKVCGECILVDNIEHNGCHHHIATDYGVSATCTQNGYTDKVYCTICNFVFSEKQVIMATGHNVVTDAYVPADCTHNGLTEGSHCSVCGQIFIPQNTIPKLNHDLNTILSASATCTEYGHSTYKKCSRCDYTEDLVIYNPNGHTPVTDDAVEPNCYHVGYTEGSHCSVCGEILVNQNVIPVSHSFNNGICHICHTQDPDVTINLSTFFDDLSDYKNSVKEIYFGNLADYGDIVSTVNEYDTINLSLSRSGDITVYPVSDGEYYKLYILSLETIYFYQNADSAFKGAENLREIHFDNISSKYVTSAKGMFSDLEKLFSLDLTMLNTSDMEDMSDMFKNCTNLKNLYMSFDTSKVKNMSSMFYRCKRLINFDVSGFVTDNVTNMENMFLGCEAITTLTLNFNTKGVTSFRAMFAYCEGLETLNIMSFETPMLKDCSLMFVCNQKLKVIYANDFATDNVTSSYDMFADSTALAGYDDEKTDITMATTMGYFSSP